MAGRPHIIVIGNEKGGCGKSTTAMHLLVSLMGRGARPAALDLDARQRSLSRYVENRQAFAADQGLRLATPPCLTVPRSDASYLEDAQREERDRFDQALGSLAKDHDVVLVDCPGSDTYLARYAHAHADTLITPLNDSFVDVDLLARVDGKNHKVVRLSLYSEMVYEARKYRAVADGGQIDWIVIRNRVSMLKARNKARVEEVLLGLQKRLGFRYVQGLSERVIYRELFLKGLTLLDLKEPRTSILSGGLTMSHVAARAEIRRLVEQLKLGDRLPKAA